MEAKAGFLSLAGPADLKLFKDDFFPFVVGAIFLVYVYGFVL